MASTCNAHHSNESGQLNQTSTVFGVDSNVDKTLDLFKTRKYFQVQIHILNYKRVIPCSRVFRSRVFRPKNAIQDHSLTNFDLILNSHQGKVNF